jgi:hypothetical protein
LWFANKSGTWVNVVSEVGGHTTNLGLPAGEKKSVELPPPPFSVRVVARTAAGEKLQWNETLTSEKMDLTKDYTLAFTVSDPLLDVILTNNSGMKIASVIVDNYSCGCAVPANGTKYDIGLYPMANPVGVSIRLENGKGYTYSHLVPVTLNGIARVTLNVKAEDLH